MSLLVFEPRSWALQGQSTSLKSMSGLDRKKIQSSHLYSIVMGSGILQTLFKRIIKTLSIPLLLLPGKQSRSLRSAALCCLLVWQEVTEKTGSIGFCKRTQSLKCVWAHRVYVHFPGIFLFENTASTAKYLLDSQNPGGSLLRVVSSLQCQCSIKILSSEFSPVGLHLFFSEGKMFSGQTEEKCKGLAALHGILVLHKHYISV